MKNILNALKGRSLVEPGDFSLEELDALFDLAWRIEEDSSYLRGAGRGKLLAALFFEPSTRTRLSFEAAMLRLGGACLGFADPLSSSASKGESLADTVRMAASYADAIVMRNPKEGAALLASRYADVPVINAGDGGHHHPTQTLTDLYTIKRLLGAKNEPLAGTVRGRAIGFCGDLKFGRTVHSLAKALSAYNDTTGIGAPAGANSVKMVFISPEELNIPEYITRHLRKQNVQFFETRDFEGAIEELDILYMTRVQRERFFNEEDYIRLKDRYILTGEKLEKAKQGLIVLHPLPRVNEIATEVDADPRAAYFKQAKFGMYIRMALLAALLGIVE
ncbi:MAG: aspartate carbamoyltransferase [Spirochaetaceae bacterium]|jgi:aspartate carbamoyltransferase catalytic subunit|nr:aspartate carbamoyltransferase [Spirochaetaceae bacterium]